MKTITLVIEATLDVVDDASDEAVCEAICNQFAGTEGQGLQQYPGNGEVVAPRHYIEIAKKTNPGPGSYHLDHIWGSKL